MDVEITVKHGTDMSRIGLMYPVEELVLDEENDCNGNDCYFIARPNDGDDDGNEWSDEDHDDAEYWCGVVKTLIPAAYCCVEGCGPWAMGQIRSGGAYKSGCGDALAKIAEMNKKGNQL
jgi:hypothetical protein